MLDTIIRNARLVLRHEVVNAELGIRDGKIAVIADRIAEPAAAEIDAAGQYVLPGMVDVHMHISEPGRTEWEGYETGSQAMAAGGTTCFVEMPLNTIPATTDVASMELKIGAATGQCHVDYALMGGLVPWNFDDLKPMSQAGVAAYKCFVATCGSGKPGDFKNVNDFELYEGMKILAETGDLLVIHCENAALTDGLGKKARAEGKSKVSDYVASRPVFTEVEAVQRVLLIAKETGCRVHIAHNSCPEAVDAIQRAIADGVDASVESCPHYFLLATEELDAIGARAKCSPPIRDYANQARMWDYLAQGKIDILGSDHSPCTFDLKDKENAFDAWGGLSACQNSVDAMFDAGVKQRGISPVLLARVLATNPAERFGLKDKGEIAIGKDADLVFIDPAQSYTVKAEGLYYKNKHSAYEGREIGCRVTRTLLRGHAIFELGQGFAARAQGQLIRVGKQARS
ncbi:allantoinase AllB [Craterilacuibacter sinensis]|uniref:Allantoinase n=1 Tax=Craterilacuibacter sinensis TaxID=2686017 RepID=A0A845BM71_9NEIS|nr:allantoinase AllB [Craterilacuibacter sinensis]MXR36500.1 allantoinase AllB [Craterilacuibacter sinensis]